MLRSVRCLTGSCTSKRSCRCALCVFVRPSFTNGCGNTEHPILGNKANIQHWQTIAFTVLCFSQMGHVMAIRSEEIPFNGVFSNKPLLALWCYFMLYWWLSMFLSLIWYSKAIHCRCMNGYNLIGIKHRFRQIEIGNGSLDSKKCNTNIHLRFRLHAQTNPS
jgi:magnesium-transporting ATPase (P-type)